MIPFSLPHVPDEALKQISIALKTDIQQGNGPFSKIVEERIETLYPGYSCFLTPSCTASLEMAMMINKVGPGDEVIIPSFNFTSAATAVTKFFAIPVFCDINPRTGCIDIEMVLRLISPRTKVVIWVNYGGQDSSIQDIKSILVSRNIALVEDAAHNFGVLTSKQDKPDGDQVVFSFHATKNVQCGEGGAILLRDQDQVDQIHNIREKGTNRRDFMMGKASKYRWVSKGGSYLLAEINSALLETQLRSFYDIQSNRLSTVQRYRTNLCDVEEFNWTLLPGGSESAAHLFALLAPDGSTRDRFIDELRMRGITAVSHYEDLATSPAGVIYGKMNKFPTTHSISFSKRIVRLPVFYGIGDKLEKVIDEVKSVIKHLSLIA